MKTLEFPFSRQTYNYDCGARAMHAVLAYYGIDIPERDVLKIAGTTKGGTPVHGMYRVANHFKLKCILKSKMNIDQVKQYINKKFPVILLLQAWPDKKVKDWKNDWIDGHYVVAIGYDKNKIYFEDPSSSLRTYLLYKELEDRWHDIDLKKNKKKYNHLGIIVMGKKKFCEHKAIHMD